VHDHAQVAERDAGAAERLEDAGWLVIRFRHDAVWKTLADENPDVFGTGR
jgi:very-short-patch-repair endonuclease